MLHVYRVCQCVQAAGYLYTDTGGERLTNVTSHAVLQVSMLYENQKLRSDRHAT